jgi:DNA-binding response OmpR family regulator
MADFTPTKKEVDSMSRILIIAGERKAKEELHSGLVQEGFACSMVSGTEEAIEQVVQQAPDLVLVEMNGHSEIWELPRRIKRERGTPIIALIHRGMMDRADSLADADDFVIKPYDVPEVILRAKRLLQGATDTQSGEIIRCGDLAIDLDRCEVSVGGRLIMLTFREYELLKFLANNKRRVFTREALLNKVWGFDYYGGDRTVDVHIRRLRIKLEDSAHTFIDTIRNIGYRFQSDT